ncbi:MAG: prepilin-type N-terminal cleavage/methylation domain-containing protein [Candidatus Omnitrophica bacterium]|nr:prepilin-type N-terminal cleavage/methylation domain-containing protein [Candidatus Omnitrophota bacterium]
MTLIEVLVVVIVIGILAAIGGISYTHSVREAHDRDAVAYLHVLRHAALAYRESWNAYPTALAQVPEAMVPAATQASSRWTYGFSGADPTQWTLPTATEKSGAGQLQILENGTIQ